MTSDINNGKNNIEATIAQSDPMALQQFDHPGLILVSKPLDENNYGQWSRSMRIALIAKNKIGFIDGKIKTPETDDEKYHMWERSNHMVLSWMLNSVHPDIAESIMYSESATEVWNDLRDRFSQGNDARIHQIRQEIAEHRQGNQSMSKYYTKLKALWDEMGSYRDPIKCTCGNVKALTERDEKERVMQFLMGVNDSFSTVHGNILMISSFPDTRKVHAILMQHERKLEVATNFEGQQSINWQKSTNWRPNQRSNNLPTKIRSSNDRSTVTARIQRQCSHCGMVGHNVDACYFVHDFRLGHKFHGKDVKPRNKRSTNAAITSTLDPSEGKILTAKEYEKIVTLLNDKAGNDKSYVNTSGFDYEEDDWLGKAE